MNKYLKRILLLGILGLGIFFFNDWSKKRINLEREELSNGLYKYSDERISFVYPYKLRNCYECTIKTGNIYTVLTDGEYIIMYMSNKNSSYLIQPKKQFVSPESDKEKIIRNQIDNLLIKENIDPTDSFILDSLVIKSIKFISDEEEDMNYEMEILGNIIDATIKGNELSNDERYFGLNKEDGELNKFTFTSESGVFFFQKDNKEFFFEFQKIRRNTLYTLNKNTLTKRDMNRFFNSFKIK